MGLVWGLVSTTPPRSETWRDSCSEGCAGSGSLVEAAGASSLPTGSSSSGTWLSCGSMTGFAASTRWRPGSAVGDGWLFVVSSAAAGSPVESLAGAWGPASALEISGVRSSGMAGASVGSATDADSSEDAAGASASDFMPGVGASLPLEGSAGRFLELGGAFSLPGSATALSCPPRSCSASFLVFKVGIAPGSGSPAIFLLAVLAPRRLMTSRLMRVSTLPGLLGAAAVAVADGRLRRRASLGVRFNRSNSSFLDIRYLCSTEPQGVAEPPSIPQERL